MGTATTEFRNRIVLIFDFDGTLAPNTIEYILEQLDKEALPKKKNRVKELIAQGWDHDMANHFALIEAAKRFDLRKKDLEKISRTFDPFEGVMQMFEKVEREAHDILPDIEVEFYLLTCGFLDILRPMEIFQKFKQAWGCELHFDGEEKPVFIKKSLTHPDKVRYILQLVKGIDDDELDMPSDVYQDIPAEQWYVPLDQVIYLGDGKSDMPAFSLMRESNGIAIGIVNADEIKNWEGYQSMHKMRKVENLATADYHEGSELMQAIQFAVNSVCHRVKLRKLGKGE